MLQVWARVICTVPWIGQYKFLSPTNSEEWDYKPAFSVFLIHIKMRDCLGQMMFYSDGSNKTKWREDNESRSWAGNLQRLFKKSWGNLAQRGINQVKAGLCGYGKTVLGRCWRHCHDWEFGMSCFWSAFEGGPCGHLGQRHLFSTSLILAGAGADFVMLGGMLAGHSESGGELIERDGKKYKLFYGMSSEMAMKKYAGGVAEYRYVWRTSSWGFENVTAKYGGRANGCWKMDDIILRRKMVTWG